MMQGSKADSNVCMYAYKLLSDGLTRQTPTRRLEVFAGLRKLPGNGAIRGISLGVKILYDPDIFI